MGARKCLKWVERNRFQSSLLFSATFLINLLDQNWGQSTQYTTRARRPRRGYRDTGQARFVPRFFGTWTNCPGQVSRAAGHPPRQPPPPKVGGLSRAAGLAHPPNHQTKEGLPSPIPLPPRQWLPQRPIVTPITTSTPHTTAVYTPPLHHYQKVTAAAEVHFARRKRQNTTCVSNFS